VERVENRKWKPLLETYSSALDQLCGLLEVYAQEGGPSGKKMETRVTSSVKTDAQDMQKLRRSIRGYVSHLRHHKRA